MRTFPLSERASEPGRGMFSGRAEPSGAFFFFYGVVPGWLVGWSDKSWLSVYIEGLLACFARSDSRTTAVSQDTRGGGWIQNGHRRDPPPNQTECAGILFGAVRIPLRLCASLGALISRRYREDIAGVALDQARALRARRYPEKLIYIYIAVFGSMGSQSIPES